MAINKSKGLGSNPLDRGIFSKTENSHINTQESTLNNSDSNINTQESTLNIQQPSSKSSDSVRPDQAQDSRVTTQDSALNNQESVFLNREQEDLRGTSVRLPSELIDWVDELVRQGSRSKHKSRIPKEVWFQAALELFRAMPVDWEQITNEDELLTQLQHLESIIKSQES